MDRETMKFGDYRCKLKFFNRKFDGDPVALNAKTTNHAGR
jgi:hypothetical protein